MKLFTGSDTNTAKNKGGTVSGRRPHGSRLTLRILFVNIMAPVVLVVGFLYMGQYRDGLIRAELEKMKLQAQLFADAIAESTVRPMDGGRPFLFARPDEMEMIVPELGRRIVRRLGETTEDRTRLFDISGRLVADSERVIGPRRSENAIAAERRAEARMPDFIRKVDNILLLKRLPVKDTLPQFEETEAQTIESFPDAVLAANGLVSATAWKSHAGKIMLTAASPVRKSRNTVGVVMITSDGGAIEHAMAEVRFGIITMFAGALSLTIFLSLYLAGVIGRPLKRLARTAEAIRTSKNRQTMIPDLSRRQDEIGDLSQSLRDMTQALWNRMDMIEAFAADVAHEIKNPLTSLRSAVETLARVKSKEDHEKLLAIIQHDVKRLDRLISDISNASRLDAELSRDEMGIVDLGRLLKQLSEVHHRPAGTTESEIILDVASKKPVIARGNEGRLAQVFDNLISNALSFSPPGKPVTIRVNPDRDHIQITVEDCGPGIPEGKLEDIFERFYTERPKHEDYGSHSGLGLSIARQIVIAHGGRIFATNRRDETGQVQGAIFTVILEAE